MLVTRSTTELYTLESFPRTDAVSYWWRKVGPSWRLFQLKTRHHELRNYKRKIAISILIFHIILGHNGRFFFLMKYGDLEILSREACNWTSTNHFPKSRQRVPAACQLKAHHPTLITSQNNDYSISIIYSGLQTGFQPWSPFLYASPWQSHGVPAAIISSVGMTPVDSQSFFLCVYLKSQLSLKIPPSRHSTFYILFFLSSTDLLGHLEDITNPVSPDSHDYCRWHHCLALHNL